MLTATAEIHGRSNELALPSNWKELAMMMSSSALRRRIAAALLTLHPDIIKVHVADMMLRKWGGLVAPGHVSQVCDVLDFINLADLRDYEWSKGVSMRIWRKYAMCKEMMESSTDRKSVV